MSSSIEEILFLRGKRGAIVRTKEMACEVEKNATVPQVM